MKSRTAAIAVLLVLLSLPLVLHAQQTDPVAVVKAMTDPLNAGDMDALMAYWTDDAVMEVVHLDATYTGADEVLALFEMLAGKNFEMHIDEVLKVEGDKITTSTLMAMDDTRALGVQVVSTQVYTVQDGKIKSLWCSWSAETLAALQAATAAAAEALPDTGIPVARGGLLPTRALAMALGGLAVLGAFGLALLRRRARSRP